VTQPVRAGTPAGRWVLAATVLGSGIAFLDGTVVNVALPAIADDLDASVSSLQWTLDAYLVTLSALLLLGGSLGDRLGRRRVFVGGLGGFVVASVLCGLAPNTGALIAARALQGAGAAFLVPGSLAIISASFHPDDRSRAVGSWSGLAGVSSALGPLLGGWLIDAVSWRLIFLINLPLAAIAGWIAIRHVPESRDPDALRPDIPGAVTVTVGLAAVTYALIEQRPPVAVAGVVALVSFVLIERKSRHPMLPLSLFRSAQFTGANLTTLAVYAALGGAMFLVVLQLQEALGYSALEAGCSLLPITILMLLLSPRAGQLSQRTGPRLPMTVGPLIVAMGLLLLGTIEPGRTFWEAVLPGMVVFGLGLSLTVAPLTAAVLAAVEERHIGVGSGVNNAVARLAGLLAVAILPIVADVGESGATSSGFTTAMRLSAVVAAAGGLIALATIRSAVPVAQRSLGNVLRPCEDDRADARTVTPTH
jgi:EmrB/QacA subfamily drug resistance transporter